MARCPHKVLGEGEMKEKPTSEYTLVIPTYNRPQPFSRLIRYLDRRGVPFPVLVLDSSSSETIKENARVIEGTDLYIRHERFDHAIAPYDKFAKGLKLVDTAYCSFCADDDILFTDTVGECVLFLQQNPFYAAVHGTYVNFRETDTFNITYTAHAGGTISGDDAIKRLNQQMYNYEPVFYAVYRTDIARQALAAAAKMETLLFKEVIASSVTLIHGGVYRLSTPFLARSVAPSIPYSGWHPHEIIAKDPALLFKEYQRYSKVIMASLAADERVAREYPPELRERIVNLAHLQYLSGLLVPGILDFIMTHTMAGEKPLEIVEGIWQRWVHSGLEARPRHPRRRYPISPVRLKIRKLMAYISEQWLGRRWELGIPPLPWFDPYSDHYIDAVMADGQSRRYLLYDEFLHQVLPGDRTVFPVEIEMMVRHFSDYT